MIVEIRGANLPGRRCNPAPEHGPYDDVNVGLGRYTDPVGLLPGDTKDAVWRIVVRVAKRHGEFDYHGPQVDRGQPTTGLFRPHELNWRLAD